MQSSPTEISRKPETAHVARRFCFPVDLLPDGQVLTGIAQSPFTPQRYELPIAKIAQVQFSLLAIQTLSICPSSKRSILLWSSYLHEEIILRK
jgi:hypothetical protein